MKATFKPDALKGPYDEEAEFEFLVERARECLLWRMSPEYWDSMSMYERLAWIKAWNEMNRED